MGFEKVAKLHVVAFLEYVQTTYENECRTCETRGRSKSKAPFSLPSTTTYGFYRNSRQGWALLQFRCMHNLSPVILVLI